MNLNIKKINELKLKLKHYEDMIPVNNMGKWSRSVAIESIKHKIRNLEAGVDISHEEVDLSELENQLIPRKLIYIDMDGVLVDFKSGISALTPEELKNYEDRLDEVPGIFSRMVPIQGAIESLNLLAKHYDIYILSTAPWENPNALNDKLHWIKQYIGDIVKKKVIFSHNKHLNIGDYLIDDRTANGAGAFKGIHIHFGSEQFPDWRAVLAYFNLLD